MNTKNKIEKLREELHANINKYGIGSKEVNEISLKLDKLINKYNKKQYMNYEYEKAIIALRKVTFEFGGFPTVQEWNKYAREYMLLSSESLKSISKLTWNQLRNEIKKKIF